ncbi:MAG: hypothetical protein GF398_09040 [Chitinivibrionales bacterium]|nr:hypothetical protein [Chitinivibrionales bacterium]
MIAILNSRQGSALLTVVMIALIGGLTVSATMHLTSRNSKATRKTRVNASLLNIVEAGKEHGLALLRSGSIDPEAGSTIALLQNIPFDNGTYSVSCKANADADMIWLSASGEKEGISKQIEVACMVGQDGNSPVDFEIDDGEVVPQERFKASATVIGAAMSYGGYWDMPITLQITIAGQTLTPFGDWDYAQDGNVNDDENPRYYEFPDAYGTGEAVSIQARAWNKKSSSYDGSSNSHWELYNSASSNPHTSRVWVLRDGDDVPQVSGFLDQSSIQEYVSGYIEDGKITLEQNQAIYLFELCSNCNLGSSDAADFQDAVVLITLVPEDEEFIASEGGGGGQSQSKVEAEDMTLSGYYAENESNASDGRLIKLSSSSGYASFTYSGAPGTYDVAVKYIDEDDGNSTMALYINDIQQGSWNANETTSGWVYRNQTFEGVTLSNGDVIKLAGNLNSSEYARFDYVEIFATSSNNDWKEAFTLNNGTTVDNGSTAWTRTKSGNGSASVQNGKFTVADGASATWTSQVIDISSTAEVDISISISESGDLEGSGEYRDYINLYYKVDGGSQQGIISKSGNFGSATTTVDDVEGSTIQIIADFVTTYWDEEILIDDVTVIIPQAEEEQDTSVPYQIVSWREVR